MKVTLKEIIRLGCTFKGKTQSKVAIEMGRSVSNVTYIIQHGNPQLRTLIRILKTFDAKLKVEFENGEEYELKHDKE